MVPVYVVKISASLTGARNLRAHGESMSYEWTESARPARRRSQPAARLSADEVRPSMVRAAGALFEQQSPEVFWCGELTADTTLESDYILLQLWLHQPDGASWNPPS